MLFNALRSEYARLWDDTRIEPSRNQKAKDQARTIVRNKSRYTAVSDQTGVPWFFIGIIHMMESGARFDRHLHNGDPLTARTRRVPRGRPKTGKPPFTWEESAIDALLQKGLNKITDWSVERIAYELERYNGFGYRRHHPTVLSPYLWAGTNHYTRGKYVSDGRFSATAVSKQIGGMALLLRLLDSSSDVRVARRGAHAATPVAASKPSTSEPKITRPTAGILGAIGGALTTLAAQVDAYIPFVILALVVVALLLVAAIIWQRVTDTGSPA